MASCTREVGTRTVSDEVPSVPVAYDTLTTNPPRDRVVWSACCVALERASVSLTSIVRFAVTRCARPVVGPGVAACVESALELPGGGFGAELLCCGARVFARRGLVADGERLVGRIAGRDDADHACRRNRERGRHRERDEQRAPAGQQAAGSRAARRRGGGSDAAISSTRARRACGAAGRAVWSSCRISAEVMSVTLSSSCLSARLSRVETAVGLMPSTRAAASPSRSSTTRSAITSRSPALSVASAISSAGERPFHEHFVDALRHGGGLLAAPASALGAEPVERGRPGDAEQPGPGARAARVEAAPES